MVYEYYGHNDWRDYHLSHHGVLGQKWGIRRYQPYGSGGYNPKGDKGKFVGKRGSTSSGSSGSAKEGFFSPGRRIARLTNRRTRLENRLSKTNSRLESANAKISKVENDQRRNMIKSRLAASNNQLERTIDSNTRKDKSMLRSMIEPGFVKERRAVKTERAKEQIEKNEARNRAMDSEYLNLIEQRDETAYEADRISKKIERINSKIAKLQVEQLKEQDSAEAKQKVDESMESLGMRQYQPYGSAYSSYTIARNQRRSINPDKYSYDKDVTQKARKAGETAEREGTDKSSNTSKPEKMMMSEESGIESKYSPDEHRRADEELEKLRNKNESEYAYFRDRAWAKVEYEQEKRYAHNTLDRNFDGEADELQRNYMTETYLDETKPRRSATTGMSWGPRTVLNKFGDVSPYKTDKEELEKHYNIKNPSDETVNMFARLKKENEKAYDMLLNDPKDEKTQNYYRKLDDDFSGFIEKTRKNQTSSSSSSNDSGGSSNYNERKQQAMNDVRSSKYYDYDDYSDRALATELVRNGKNPSDDNIAKYRKALKKENAAYEKSMNYNEVVLDSHPEKWNEKTADRYEREYKETMRNSRRVVDEMDDLDA